MRSEQPGRSDLPPERPAQKPPAIRRVVICDRDEQARSAVAMILRDEGFEVVGRTADPRDAAELTAERRPDVVVMGLRSTGADDVGSLAAVAALQVAPVVVVAADSTAALVAGARDAGALAYLTGPPGRTALVPAVEVSIARFSEIARLVADVRAASRRLESRKVIDRAKGLLMTHRRMSEQDAFRWIQRTAMDRRKTSAAVAAQVVAELADSPVRVAS